MSSRISGPRGIRRAGVAVENEPIIKSDGAGEVMQWQPSDGGADGVYITEGGSAGDPLRLGVGVAAPTVELDVTGGIKASGNVMIGSGTAGRLLELSNASNPALRINNGNSTADIGVASSAGALLTGAADDDLVIARNGAYGIAIGTNGNTRLALDASGNVNVNTGYLKIGPTDSTADFRLYRNDSSIADGNAIGDVNFGGADASNDAAARIRAKADGGDWTATSSPTALEFATCPVGSETLATRLTISSTGETKITRDGDESCLELSTNNAGCKLNLVEAATPPRT